MICIQIIYGFQDLNKQRGELRCHACGGWTDGKWKIEQYYGRPETTIRAEGQKQRNMKRGLLGLGGDSGGAVSSRYFIY